MTTTTGLTVGSDEARSNFSELLARVEAGDEITITRHGTPIAQLVPIQHRTKPGRRRATIAAMRELAKRQSLGGLKIKDLAAEERR